MIVGKYYRVGLDKNYIAKYIEIKDDIFISDGYFIHNNKYRKSFNHRSEITREYNNPELVDISEIINYLPKEHPDRINFYRKEKIKLLLNYE